MKIIDILNKNEKTMSFEVFPPKRGVDFDSVRVATEEIARLRPAYMSVTYGAGGGISEYTIDIAKNIKEKYQVPMLAHLTCVASSKETVAEKIQSIRQAGIKNVMALRGDLTPELEHQDPSTWDYAHAYQLVSQIKETCPDFCIGGACYPEVHPESKSRQEDITYLKEKVDAGCDFLTTQMFFDNEKFYQFLDNTAKAGIKVPIIPGIMPVTNIVQVKKMVALSGAYMPPEFLDIICKYQDDSASLKKAGIEYALKQIDDLYSKGARNVHVYSMNKPDVAEEIWKKLY